MCCWFSSTALRTLKVQLRSHPGVLTRITHAWHGHVCWMDKETVQMFTITFYFPKPLRLIILFYLNKNSEKRGQYCFYQWRKCSACPKSCHSQQNELEPSLLTLRPVLFPSACAASAAVGSDWAANRSTPVWRPHCVGEAQALRGTMAKGCSYSSTSGYCLELSSWLTVPVKRTVYKSSMKFMGFFFKGFTKVFFFFNWSTVDLQCCVDFCCTEKWFSYIPSFSYSFPSHTGCWIQLLVLCSRTSLFIHSLNTSLHLLIPNSQLFPHLLSHQSIFYVCESICLL